MRILKGGNGERRVFRERFRKAERLDNVILAGRLKPRGLSNYLVVTFERFSVAMTN